MAVRWLSIKLKVYCKVLLVKDLLRDNLKLKVYVGLFVVLWSWVTVSQLSIRGLIYCGAGLYIISGIVACLGVLNVFDVQFSSTSFERALFIRMTVYNYKNYLVYLICLNKWRGSEFDSWLWCIWKLVHRYVTFDLLNLMLPCVTFDLYNELVLPYVFNCP